MANLALYRKYRSQDFKELVGQNHITSSLSNAIKSGRVAHAYLFAGPRGVGKTSTARIFARNINGLDPKKDLEHLDIIEIDAASNRRIDEIRDLREKVHSAPTSAKYKVYIIDEVHMLTNEAFNALLKTLEEPPAHVIFILATTEAHKLPETIVSRTQRYNFRPISSANITKHLAYIAKQEKIKIEPSALELVALASEGSFRDAISLLDQLANLSSGTVKAADVTNLLGLADAQLIGGLAEALLAKQPQPLLELLDQASTKGYSQTQLLQQLLRSLQLQLRSELSEAEPTPKAQALSQLIKQLAIAAPQVSASPAALEAMLVAECLGAPVASKQSVKEVEPKAKPVAEAAKPKAKTAVDFSEDGWLKALTQLKSRNSSLYALLRSGAAEYDKAEDCVVVKFRFQFHRRRLEEAKNKQIVEEVLERVYGRPIPVKPTIIEAEVETDAPAAAEKDQDKEALDSVLQILGGEVING